MTELAQHSFRRVGSVRGTPQPSLSLVKSSPQVKQKIKLKRLELVLRMLYEAIVKNKGIYSVVSMETHAPQTKYYPGSLASQKTIVEEVNPFMQLLDESLYDAENLSEKQSGVLRAVFEKQVPQNQVGRESKVILPGTLEHRRWLWFATLTDRREISDRVYHAHCKIYEDYPEFYNKEVVGISPSDFKKAFKQKSYKIGSPSQSSEFWLVCAKTLFEEFDGDPIKLLKHAGWSVEKVYAWKKKEKKIRGYDPIPGWGRKLISLYFLYLSELGEQLPYDAFPADVHAQAILQQTGCFDFGDRDKVYSSNLAEFMRKDLTALCEKKNWSIHIIAHASWLLGSQLCVRCSKSIDASVLCPAYKECKGRIDTGPYFTKGMWLKNAENMTKGGNRPKFGIPSDVPPRLQSMKNTKVTITTMPLFVDRV